jgi:D-3-phosphoglycerate dehydrogenase
MPRLLTPFDQGDIRILLLENVSQGAVDMLRQQGYQVDFHAKAWSEDELCDKIGQYHAIGIRSKTKLTAKVFRRAEKVCSAGAVARHVLTFLSSCCSSAASASAPTRST